MIAINYRTKAENSTTTAMRRYAHILSYDEGLFKYFPSQARTARTGFMHLTLILRYFVFIQGLFSRSLYFSTPCLLMMQIWLRSRKCSL